MGEIIGAYVMPHPPIILKEIGKGEEQAAQRTIDAMTEIARSIKEKEPDIIVMITPHGPLFRDAVTISAVAELKGDFSEFGAQEVRFNKINDLNLANKIEYYAGCNNIMCALMDANMAKKYDASIDMDHGTMVPLYFIDKEYLNYKLVHITYGFLSGEELYRFGKCIQEALREVEATAVVIASGDLSHRLNDRSAAGYNRMGKIFDQRLLQFLRDGDTIELLSMDADLVEKAGECGLRAIQIMLGAIDGYDNSVNVLSYEGPYGVGYGVVKLDIGEYNKDKELLDMISKNNRELIKKIRAAEDEYVVLAREALEKYVKHNITMTPDQNIYKELLKKTAGVFVSIKKHGELRGCIGTIYSTTNNIAEEIIQNAIQAGMDDPRFYPVAEEELDQLTYTVDIVEKPQKIQGLHELDVEKYGVIVTKGAKSGLLLPNLEGVDSVEEQVKIALRKAGIRQNEEYNLQRFEVVRHR